MLTAFACSAGAQVPDTPEEIADKLDELGEQAAQTRNPDFIDQYNEIWDGLTPEQQETVEGIRDAKLDAQAAESAQQANQAGSSYAAEQWTQDVSDIFVDAYRELPEEVLAKGAAAAGEKIQRSRDFYKDKIPTLQQARDQIGSDIAAATNRKTAAQESLKSHLANQTIWQCVTCFLGDDPVADALNAEISDANNLIGVLSPMWIAADTALETTITSAANYEQALVLDEIKNNPDLLNQEEQRRTDELIGLERELATSKSQFVAGHEQFQQAIKEADAKIAEAKAEGNEVLVGVHEGNKENIELTYNLWLDGQKTSIFRKGLLIVERYDENAAQGIGPRDKVSLISNITSCGADPLVVLEGRDPITGELLDPEARARVSRTADSADGVFSGAEWGSMVDYDWGDWSYDFIEQLYTWDTLTGAPMRFGYYALGAGEAVLDAVYDLGVFIYEGYDFAGESAQWYASQVGLEIDVFGHENLDAFSDVWAAGSGLDSKGIYDVTQGVLDSYGRRVEQQAGRGEKGTYEAMQDLGWGVTTVGTVVIGPEEVLIRAATKGARAARVLAAGANAGGDLVDVATAGARAVDAGTDAAGISRASNAGTDIAPGSVAELSAGPPTGSAPGQGISDEFAEAATPRGDDMPGAPTGPAPGSVPGQGISDEFAEAATPRGDGAPAGAAGAARAGNAGGTGATELTVNVDKLNPLSDTVILTRSDPGSRALTLENRIGTGAGVDVYEIPGWPNLVAKVTDATGSDLNRVGAAANEAVDRTAAAAPRVHATYNVNNGDMAGYTVQIVDRAPPHFGSDAAKGIKTVDGGMTAGQFAALGRGLDAYADVNFVVADLKMDNFTFWRLAGLDEWLWIPIDGNMFIPFKSPQAAKAFHADLFKLPDDYLIGPWRNNLGKFQNDLAGVHNSGADWNRLDDLLETPFYDTLASGATSFPYNPMIGRELPALRTAETATDAARGGQRAVDDATNELAAPAAGAVRAATSPAPDLAPNWLELDAQGLAPPFLPRGLPPRWLTDMGVDRLPGYLGNSPVRAGTCTIGPLPAGGTTAARSGLNLHVPWQWLKSQRIFPDEATATALLPFVGGRFIAGFCDADGDCSGATGVVSLRFDSADEPRVASLANDSGAFFVGADSMRTKQAVPNDPYFSSRGSWGQAYDDQWAFENIKLVPDSRPNRNASRDGAEPMIVAVIDTGLAWNHRDIGHDRLWLNNREIPANGIDDDDNGYVDDIVGWNFVHDNNLPWDLDGHGTLVAGIIGAAADNAIGTAGINPQARIMVLRALDEIGNGRSSDIAEAIVYATNNGARIINLSVGSAGLDPTEQLALDYAYDQDVLVVVAAGNDGATLDDYGPGGANNVLTVAASDDSSQRLALSNWGPQVDLVAPGMDILGPRAMGTDLMGNMGLADYVAEANVVGKDGGYYRASGTSFAAPIVAGVASLVWDNDPTLTAADVRRILQQSAQDVGPPGRDQLVGYGLLDAQAALSADPAFFIDVQISGVAVVQDSGNVYLEILGSLDGNQLKSGWLEYGVGTEPNKWQRLSGDLMKPVVEAPLGRIPAAELGAEPTWTVRLIGEHANGQRREHRFQVDLN